MAKNEAVFIKIRCAETYKDFYMRYDYGADDRWVLTYGVPADQLPISSSSNDSVSLDLSNYRYGPQYKCPFCGNTGYVRHGKCGRLSCGSGNHWEKCAYCDVEIEINGGTIESIGGGTKGSAQ